MKLHLLLAVSLLTGCSSCLHSTEGIACRLDHAYSPGRLTIKATVTNHTGKPVTFVDNHNFYALSVWARDGAQIETKEIEFIDFSPPSLADTKVVASQKSIQFTEDFRYRRISPAVIEIYSKLSPSEPILRVEDSKLKLEFSYDLNLSQLPWFARLFYPNPLAAELKSSAIIEAP